VETPTPLTGPPEGLPRPPAPTWRWWEALLAYLAFIVVGGFLLVPFNSDFLESTKGELVGALIFDFVLAGGTLLWLFGLHRRTVGALGKPTEPVRDVAIGTGWGLVARIAAYVAGAAVILVLDATIERELPTPEQLDPDITGLTLFLAVLFALVAAPVAEELFFRGFLFVGLRRQMGFVPAALLSSVGFSLVHLQPEGLLSSLPLMVAVGVAALFFAWAYERRRSILAPMAAHAMFNLVGVLVIFWAQ
jgi:membrane protease YdiL (CAAX protease family)